MRLTHISIENFKGIRDRVEIPLRSITLLFGANSAGKSTILQALLYLRELLEHQNADADFLSASGAAIHLGGFRQMVHGHDLSRSITIGIRFSLDDDGLPGQPEPDETPEQEKPEKDEDDYAAPPPRDYRSVAMGSNLETAGVSVTISWDKQLRSPRISRYTVYGNDREMASATPGPLGKQILEIRAEHSVFSNILDYETLNFLGQAHYVSGPQAIVDGLGFMEVSRLLLLQATVIPRWYQPLAAEELDDSHSTLLRLQELRWILRPIVTGTGELALAQLRKIRYIGPVREFPERWAESQRTPREDRWASGLGAWDWMGRDTADESHALGLRLLERTLADKDGLDLGYSVKVSGMRQVSEDSELHALFESIRLASEPEELVPQLKQLLEIEYLKLPVQRRVVITDLRNFSEVAAQDVGNGVTQVIPVVAGVIAPGAPILAVEQPELHLHPAIQCRLADVFVRAVRGGQERLFLLESHSEHLMLRLMRRIRQTSEGSLSSPDLMLTKDDLQVIYVESHEGRSIFRDMPLNSKGEWVKEWPGGFFDEALEELF